MGRIERQGIEKLKGAYQISAMPFGLDRFLNKNPRIRGYLDVPSFVDTTTLLVHFYESKEHAGPAKAYELFINQPLEKLAEIPGLGKIQIVTINPLLHVLLDYELRMINEFHPDHAALTEYKDKLPGSAPAQRPTRVFATNVYDAQNRRRRRAS